MAEVLGTEAKTPWKDIDRYFPRVEDIEECQHITDTLGVHGFISARSKTIASLADKIINGQVNFDGPESVEQLKENLLTIKGIGPWSAEYISMRALSWPDAFPVSDLVIKNKLFNHLCDEGGRLLSDITKDYSKYILNKKYENLAILWSQNFRPWRSYMSIGIWNDLIKY